VSAPEIFQVLRHNHKAHSRYACQGSLAFFGALPILLKDQIISQNEMTGFFHKTVTHPGEDAHPTPYLTEGCTDALIAPGLTTGFNVLFIFVDQSSASGHTSSNWKDSEIPWSPS
jgi:hypothetical protein